MNNPWAIVGVIVLAVVVICLFLWWHGHRSKAMADKPAPKDTKPK